MSTGLSEFISSLSAQTLDLIADSLAKDGHITLHNILPANLIGDLENRAHQLSHDYKPAGIGREQQHQINNVVRSDQIQWMDHQHPIETLYLKEMEALRTALNRRLFMGLFDYEAHFAHYPTGAFYKRHVDAFKGETNRVLTTVLYLNNNWLSTDGGELYIYDADLNHIKTVLPESGTLVIFLSDEFPHEVKTALRDRYSIAGWFRVNNSTPNRVDPPL